MTQVTEKQELLEALDKMYKLYNYVEDPFVTDYTDKISFHANLGTIGKENFEFTIVLSKNTKIVMMFWMTVRYKRPQELYVMFMPELGQTVLPEGFNSVCIQLAAYLLKKGENTDCPRFLKFVDIPKEMVRIEEPKKSLPWPVELEYAEIDQNTVDLTSYDASIVKPATKFSAFREYTIHANFSELKKPIICNGFIITHAVNQQSKNVAEIKETIFMGVEYDLDQRQFAFYHITEISPVFEFKKLSDDIVEDRELYTFLTANKFGYQKITQKYIIDNVLEIKSDQEIIQEKLLGIFRGISVKEFKTDYSDSIHFAHVPSGGTKHMYDVSFVKEGDGQLRPNKVMMSLAIGITDVLNELSVYFIPDTLISISQPPYFDELVYHFAAFMRKIFNENDLNLEISSVFVPTKIEGYTESIREEPKGLVDVLDGIFGTSTYSRFKTLYSTDYRVVKKGTAMSSQLYEITFRQDSETKMLVQMQVSEKNNVISLIIRNSEAPNHVTRHYKALLDNFAYHLYLQIQQEKSPVTGTRTYYNIEISSGVTSGYYEF